MKTPMQEVYENFNKMSDADFKAWMLNTDLLEKERKVMCNFTADYTTLWNFQPLCGQVISIQDYYNETFKTKER